MCSAVLLLYSSNRPVSCPGGTRVQEGRDELRKDPLLAEGDRTWPDSFFSFFLSSLLSRNFFKYNFLNVSFFFTRGSTYVY